jgi:hypothetical protein
VVPQDSVHHVGLHHDGAGLNQVSEVAKVVAAQ